jgi:sterol desaturase/sphingolipid hydroxylase (fatty acid hydroxylase superfamily)
MVMSSSFYSTVAQVLPVVLLAFLWDSGFLRDLRGQRRPRRNEDPRGVLFWTKPRVRAYSLFVAGIIVGATATALLVLGGLVRDGLALRWIVWAAAALALGTLLVRLGVDIIHATTNEDEPTNDDHPENADLR